MDPTDFLKAMTSHNSTRTMDTEDATQQSSFSSTDDGAFIASASLDFDLHQNGSGDAAGGGGGGGGLDYSSASQHRYEFCGNDSMDSLMLEESFALGESFSCAGADEQGPSASSLLLGEWGPPLRRMPHERPDLSTVIDIEEDDEEEEMEEKEGDKIEDYEPCYDDHRSSTLKTQTSSISVEVHQG